MYRPFGADGIIAFQAALYAGVALLMLFLVQRLSSVASFHLVLVLAGVLALYPDLLASIPKLWDTELATLLLLAFTALCLSLEARKPALLACLGVVWGIGLSVRPNFALLILPLGYAVRLAYVRSTGALLRGLAVGCLALATVSVADTIAHGSLYFPQNGPYNLFAGANPYTRHALLTALNAEPSIGPGMADHGYPAIASYSLELRLTYTRFALGYIASHPLQWLGLAVVKLATLLRPDTKIHPLDTGAGMVRLLTSLSFPAWLLLLAGARPLRPADRLILLVVVGYVLPFLLTNADPRFCVPLDALLLSHAGALFLRRKSVAAARLDPVAATSPRAA